MDATLAFVARNFAPGSKIIFDYMYTSLLGGVAGHGEIRNLHHYRRFSGEDLTFGIPEVLELADFNAYQGFPQRLAQELDQIPRMASAEGDRRFYYSGFAQAALLDRLLAAENVRILARGCYDPARLDLLK